MSNNGIGVWDEIFKRSNERDKIAKRANYEAELRTKHPALQDLWDQYQAMIRLVESGNSER